MEMDRENAQLMKIRPGLYKDLAGNMCVYMTGLSMQSGVPATPEAAWTLRGNTQLMLGLLTGALVTEMMD